MRIKINHVSKTEGSSGFEGVLLRGNIAKARIEVQEDARLIEGLLLGRHFSDAPIITARICGICPVVHNLTAIKALETALGVKVTPDIVKLRKIMLLAQIIHSHGLHLFFFSLPDFKNVKTDFGQIKKYPVQTKKILALRQYANNLIKTISGRAIHPINSEVGGFKKEVNLKAVGQLINQSGQILSAAVDLVEFFQKLNYPKFTRKTNFVSLSARSDYAIYDGEIKINTKKYLPSDFLQEIKEIEVGTVKRTSHGGKVYMLGALARVIQNNSRLNPAAKKIFQKSKIVARNTHYNILAQAVEVVHAVEEIKKIWESAVGPRTRVRYNINPGFINPINPGFKTGVNSGLAACEAPRGTLFHYYEIDSKGMIQKSNIITPTAQFLNNLEADLKILIPQTKRFSQKKRETRLKMLIRAYDPCFSCASH